jgi:YVTN family beta-propeller protein
MSSPVLGGWKKDVPMRTHPHALAAVAAAAALAALSLAGAACSSAVPGPAARPTRPVTAYVVGTPPCLGNTVTPIRTATDKALKAIKVGVGTDAIAITPDGTTAHVVSGAVPNAMVCGQDGTPANAVTPIRTATNTALKPIKVGEYPNAIAITPNGQTAYVVNDGSGTVTPINTATNTPGKAIRFGKPTVVEAADHIAITPEGTIVYVIAGNTVVPIRTATNTALKAITVKSSPGTDLAGLGITPDGTTAYILNEIFEPGSFPGTVIPIRTATNTAGKPITVESGASLIAFTP